MKYTITAALLAMILAGCAAPDVQHSSAPISFKQEETVQETEEEQRSAEEEMIMCADKEGEAVMKLTVNNREIPVIWEENRSVSALQEAAAEGIAAQLSMYAGNEQFGPLGTSLPSDDVRMTSHTGDIMLYCGNQIVLFYGSNTWEYTKLGRMDLSEEEITELLNDGDVHITITME